MGKDLGTDPNGASTSGTQLTRSSKQQFEEADRRLPYLRLAEILLRQFKPTEGVDPRVFMSAIVTVMCHYPIEQIRIIADPFDGLPARQNRMPTPFDVRAFCEAATRDSRRAADLRQREAIRAEEQRQYDLARATPRQSVSEIKEEMRLRGLPVGDWRD